MEDIQATGALFTWSNKQESQDRVYSRLDRELGNQQWLDKFGDFIAHFHPEGIFDHCPCTIVNRKVEMSGRRSFKYFNMWGLSEHFLGCVDSVWRRTYDGTPMFKVIKKLKALKPVLKQLNKHCFSDIENSTNITSSLLENIQNKLVDNPGNLELMQQEMEVAHELRELTVARDSFLTQKVKLQWSLAGDINSIYFHNAIKRRIMLNKVLLIEDKNGISCTDGSQIQGAFFDYYMELLGTHNDTADVDFHVVRKGKCCSPEHCTILSKALSADEVKQCLFSIPKEKSPSPDGFTSQFYKDAWSIIGEEICAAVMNFFETGKLLTQINSTIITLIPKIDRPTSVKHFSRNQGAFVKGRSILENILVCQDLVRLYNRANVSSRCMFKLDLQKAYDTIEWQFLEQMLASLRFLAKFSHLLMTCVSTSFFSLSLNGAQFGYFNGKRGLRQGDPVSPLLFTICMEYLTRILDFATQKWYFRFHPLCGGLRLNHLLFADDLLMFCKGDARSIMLLLRDYATFSASSGLKINTTKSEVVFKGVADAVRNYLWDGGVEHNIAPLVAWQKACTSKKCGGLGIKEAGILNKATVGNLVHWIHMKADRLWVQWVDHIYIHGQDWQNYHPPLDSNWNWRNVCKVKDLFVAGYHNNHWIADPKGYSIKSGYSWLQGVHPPVNWYQVVWDSWCLPKHSFMGWLIKLEALNTREKLFRIGVSDTDSFVICEQWTESHKHLFKECAFSARIITGLEEWLQVQLDGNTSYSSRLQQQVCHLVMMACWYNIWIERNRCMIEFSICKPDKVVNEVKKLVHMRVQGLVKGQCHNFSAEFDSRIKKLQTQLNQIAAEQAYGQQEMVYAVYAEGISSYEVPSYSEFIGQINWSKRDISDVKTVMNVAMTEECSALLRNGTLPKMSDPGLDKFTDPRGEMGALSMKPGTAWIDDPGGGVDKATPSRKKLRDEMIDWDPDAVGSCCSYIAKLWRPDVRLTIAEATASSQRPSSRSMICAVG
ncbi:uncharacterized protein LOC141629588 [Silene latifolia]|uniref:uncharacterized protein LOC141629588 n=1 Tax=Silene latifolia TaxID=37657 RepID=UPI003D774CFA